MISLRNLKKSLYLVALTAAISVNTSAAGLVRCLTEAVADVETAATVPGTVSVIRHGEGSFVEQGSVILELEARTEQLNIERLEVQVQNLKATLERSETLLENGRSISIEEVDKNRSEYQIAAIELELAKEAMNKKRLKAPFTGTITDLPVEDGEYCEPPQVLLRIVDTRQFYCVANIDPALAGDLTVGDVVGFVPEAEAGSGQPVLSGEIVFISPVVDSASGLLRIKALFDNPDTVVRPGEGGFLKLSEED